MNTLERMETLPAIFLIMIDEISNIYRNQEDGNESVLKLDWKKRFEINAETFRAKALASLTILMRVTTLLLFLRLLKLHEVTLDAVMSF